ncbi:MAG: energy transducer TonB [Candidatus Sulfotelmatobacter sp.]
MRNINRACARNVVLASAVALLLGTSLLAQDPPDRTSETVYEVGNGVTAPKPVYTPDPQYTDKARRKKINGTVTLAMIVTAEGKVRDVKITKSLDEGLDKQAIAAVSTWRFEPATKDGKPVAVHLRAETAFKLY